MIDRNLLPRDKADPSPVEVPQGDRDDERRSQHLLADKDEGHATEAPACFDHDYEAEDVYHVSGQARGSAPRPALTRVKDHLEQRVDEQRRDEDAQGAEQENRLWPPDG